MRSFGSRFFKKTPVLQAEIFSTARDGGMRNETFYGDGLRLIKEVIPLHEKFLQFGWLRAVVFQLNLKYLHVKITNLLRVVV